MSLNPNALFAVLVLGGTTLFLMKFLLAELGMTQQAYFKRSCAWIVISTLLFLAQDFWILMFGTAIVLFWLNKTEPNVMANYFFVICALPWVDKDIAGFGLVNQLFTLHTYRLYALVMLLPVAIRLWNDPTAIRPFQITADKYLLGYVALYVVLQYLASNTTTTMRTAFTYSLDLLLPYFVASRTLRNPEQIREALGALLIGLCCLASVACLEFIKSWFIYEGAVPSLGITRPNSFFIERDGKLRAVGTASIAISFGVAMMVGVCLWWALLEKWRTHKFIKWAMLGCLCFALYGSLSKGPWMGCVIGLAVYFALLSKSKGPAFLFALASGVTLLFLAFSNTGHELLQSLGIVEEIDINVLYRLRILDIATAVFLDSPLLGAYDFLLRDDVETLRQGQGIIDIVNTYAGIMMSSGATGLFLFCGFFFTMLKQQFFGIQRVFKNQPRFAELSSGLMGGMFACLFTIFTTSSVTIVPVLYWSLAGVIVACCVSHSNTQKNESASSELA
jgi:O-Antigen ligase